MSDMSSAHIYRFALYGRRASGKTCLLAALAMPRVTHRKGYTCTWIREVPGMLKPEGNPEEWNRADNAVSFHLGSRWLKEAIEKLQTNDLPPANPIDEPIRFRFNFTVPEHATYTVELTDYSGEIIDPELAADELAQRIQNHMMQMDGIMVLAEAPYPGHDTERLPEEFQRLQEAFSILKEKMRKTAEIDTCVALLITKWDRRSPLEYCAPENEDAELDAFLNDEPEPPHKQLHYMLKQSVAEGDYHCFPVSAFGEHHLVLQDGEEREVPKHINPLKSFGLEDPFIWAAAQSDAVVMERVKRRAANLRYWKIWQTLFQQIKYVQQSISSIIIRFPKASIEYAELKSIKKRTRRIILTHIIMYLFIAAAFVLSLKTVYDVKLVNGAEKAWAVLESLQGEPGELELANDFLQRFGVNVPHADDVNAIISRYNVLESEREAQEQAKRKVESDMRTLNDIISQLKQKETTGDITDVDIDGYVQQLSLISSMGDKEVGGLYSEAEKKVMDLRIKVASSSFDKWFRANLEGDKMYDAIFALSQNKNLEQQTVNSYVNMFVQKCDDRAKKEESSCNGYKTAREEIEKTLLNEDIVGILSGEPITAVEKSITTLKEAEDKCLYEVIRKYSEVNDECFHAAEVYVKSAPLKVMDKEVGNVIGNYNLMKKEHSVQVIINRIDWSEKSTSSWIGGQQSRIVVRFDGTEIIQTPYISDQDSKVSYETDKNYSWTLDHQGKLEIEVIYNEWGTSERNNGLFSGEWMVKDFINGPAEVPLLGYSKASHKIYFALKGIPEALNPGTLPAWKKE